MISVIIIFLGTFWEASMDIVGQKHNYESSKWKFIADYFDRKKIHFLGNRFWDNSVAWTNKWKNNDPKNGEAFLGSSTIFGCFVDGWHLTKFLWLIHVFSAVILFKPISDYFLVDLVILYAVFGLGHEFFWKLLKLKVVAESV
jgi:hypothetical protein